MSFLRGRVFILRAWALTLCLFVLPAPSFAWQETTVLAHRMRVRVDGGLEGTVSHELLVKIRGGPVKSLPLVGVDPDAEILPDATVRMAQNTWNQWPLSATARPDGSLDLHIGAPKGLRGGTYLFTLSYRTSFDDPSRVSVKGDKAILRWVGPRLDTGIDTVRLTFDLPKGEEAPVLSDQHEEFGAVAILEQVRRGDRDEVDLVRAHVAKGEPTVWEIEVSREALGLAKEGELPRALAPKAAPVVQRARQPIELWVGLGLGLLLAALSFGKARDLKKRASALGAIARPLIPVPIWLRAIGAGACFGAAGYAAGTEEPALGALLLLGAVLSGAYLAPVRATAPRGPGHWRLVPNEALEHLKPRERGWFDVSSWRGSLVFCVVVGGLAFGAYRVLPMSPYRALLLLTGALPFVPLFLTGRLSDFPVSPLTEGRAWLRYLKKALAPKGLKLSLWGRYPPDTVDFIDAPLDEARLRIELKERVQGLKAFEVAFEEGAGRFVQPCLLLRVLDDSEARARLASLNGFIRGRDVSERVVIVRPPLPTPKELLALIVEVTALLTKKAPSDEISQVSQIDAQKSPSDEVSKVGPIKARRSSGRAERTRKTGTSADAR